MAENKVRHLGVIMDGNRRWAKKHMFKSVMRGHEKGLDAFMDTCTWCQDEGIPYLTVYAFSTENWERSREEVSSLFNLMGKFFRDEIDTCISRDIRIKVIGDLSRLDAESMETVRKAESMTAHCSNLLVQIAISYGGRDEIVRAIKAYAQKAARGEVDPDSLTEKEFESYLDTAGVPDIDLVIRTGGNRRLSNFFPWQTVYSEIWFTDVLWPDFSKEDMKAALDYYETIKINKGK
ncbi:MAG: di-trans,poly-cis-decaprenylcistransferase [Lachnospiraceae bacterium]|jgi:undecaprenyl diphosphate synthase|nr:di-trans,poly-cis-decaprenylcistransferase [Lachnospiraceae bacterium]